MDENNNKDNKEVIIIYKPRRAPPSKLKYISNYVKNNKDKVKKWNKTYFDKVKDTIEYKMKKRAIANKNYEKKKKEKEDSLPKEPKPKKNYYQINKQKKLLLLQNEEKNKEDK